MRRLQAVFLIVVLTASILASAAPASAQEDVEVTVGSNDLIFSRNKQNEPAVAINPIDPDIVVAGANDNIDMEACNAAEDNTCPFTPDVGGTGVQFSTNGGATWTQPTYTGISARVGENPVGSCNGVIGDTDPPCDPDEEGDIGTLPRYDEVGLVSDGDPAMAWGPKPGAGGFSWANGARLYFANLTSATQATFRETFKGFEAIAVSRTDDIPGAIAGNNNAWKQPVIVSKQASATFADKEQIWADNAESSDFFGRVYVCWANFQGAGAAPVIVARSADGGDTWDQKQVSPASNVAPSRWGRSGCTIRTDSAGVVYVFWELFQSPFTFLPPEGKLQMVKSFDGGRRWTRPRTIREIVDPCFHVDPVTFRCVEDGVAGARNDLAAAPSVDIANGAPTGAGATDDILLTWVDGRRGPNNEDVMVSFSGDGGTNWSEATAIQTGSNDRGYYSAPALSPDGTDAWIVYNAFITPFRDTTSETRDLIGVVLHADVSPHVGPGAFTEVHRSVEGTGDPRGSSQNNLVAEFLGDYVYADATNDYATFVWNDTRNAEDCPAMDTYRMSLQNDDPDDDLDAPAVQQVCPAQFGNTDIFGTSMADPS